jgi:hypothetical protein
MVLSEFELFAPAPESFPEGNPELKKDLFMIQDP